MPAWRRRPPAGHITRGWEPPQIANCKCLWVPDACRNRQEEHRPTVVTDASICWHSEPAAQAQRGRHPASSG